MGYKNTIQQNVQNGYTKMIKKLNEILTDARKNFKRASTHRRFVVIIVALIQTTVMMRDMC